MTRTSQPKPLSRTLSLAARRAKAFGVRKQLPVTLTDPQTGARLRVTIEADDGAIAILPAGYSTLGEPKGAGSPIYLEFYEGVLTLHAWADITQEDATHRIPMTGAQEAKRVRGSAKPRTMLTMHRALQIARTVLDRQVDKAGESMFLHAARVALSLDEGFLRKVAILHDVVEDGPPGTLDALRSEGAEPKLLEAVLALSHTPGERYMDFIRRCGTNPIAREVKKADLRDHLLPERRMNLTPSHIARYESALLLLEHWV